MAGLYVHIPFCSSRCVYCGFYSTTSLSQRQRYVDALCHEMEMRGPEQPSVATVYLGGGTPSQLSAPQLKQLFDAIYNIYNVEEDAEVTLECNPDDVTDEFAGELPSLPVNRVSMGAQTFSDARLQFLHRRHSAGMVAEAVRRLRQAGIDNVSVDLMYGFPGETLTEWQQDIESALALNVEHLSAYALSYEEGTPLWQLLQRGLAEELDDELQRQMYYTLIDHLEAAGFEHYELSNFARQGRRSRHNSAYWNHTPYQGIGAAAHSLCGNRRQWNIDHLQHYMQAIEEGRVPAEEEVLDRDTLYNERVMTALRTRQGLPLQLLSDEERNYCLRVAAKYFDCGWLRRDADRLCLTRDGLFVSDRVMSDLMKA